jgi:hypothetical protein
MSLASHQGTLLSCYSSTRVHKPIRIASMCIVPVEMYQDDYHTVQEITHHTEYASAVTK